jgi:hypothetical protein
VKPLSREASYEPVATTAYFVLIAVMPGDCPAWSFAEKP